MAQGSYSFNPDQFISETDKYAKNGEWFRDMGTYVASLYNRQTIRFPAGIVNNQGAANVVGYDSPVQEILAYYAYYAGKQQNLSYGFSVTDYNNNQLPTVWIPGRDVTRIVDHTAGVGNKFLRSARISTKSESDAAKNRRTQLMEAAQLFYDMQNEFNALAQETGMQFSPLGGKEQEEELNEKLYEWIEYDYKERYEKIAYKLGLETMARNNFVEFFTNAFKHACIGGLCGVLPYLVDGRTYWKFYEGYSIIWDNNKDQELNRDANYCGTLEYMTPGEIIEEWGDELDDDAIKQIKNASTSNVGSIFPSGGILYPLVKNDHPTGPLIGVVRSYWKGLKDSRYESVEDDSGVEHIVKLSSDTKHKNARKRKESERSGEYQHQTWYKCAIIGDITWAGYGECYNNVEKLENPKEIEPPIKIWIPNVTMGASNSLVSRIYQHQDRKDWLENEITKKLNNSLGKGVFYFADKLADAETTAEQIANDLKRFGVTVIKGTSGDHNDFTASKGLLEYVDFTLDKDVNAYLLLKRDEDRIMEEIASISKIAQGQQTSYVGANTQAATIEQNSIGQATLMYSFMQFICCVVQYDINKQAAYLVRAAEEEEDEIPLLDSRDIEFLRQNPDVSFELIGAYIKFEDTISAEARIRLDQKIMALSQQPNSGITLEDIVRFETFKTYTEAINYFEYVAKRNKRAQQAAQQQQEMLMALSQEKEIAAKEGEVAMKEQGANYRKELEVGGKMSQNLFEKQTQ